MGKENASEMSELGDVCAVFHFLFWPWLGELLFTCSQVLGFGHFCYYQIRIGLSIMEGDQSNLNLYMFASSFTLSQSCSRTCLSGLTCSFRVYLLEAPGAWSK